MSWQAFVDTNLIGAGNFKQAAIYGHDLQPWAKSNDKFNILKSDLEVLKESFEDTSKLFTNGFTLNDQKYLTIKCDGRSIYGKLNSNKGGAAVVKTHQTILVGLYDENVKPELASVAIESLADQLLEANF